MNVMNHELLSVLPQRVRNLLGKEKFEDLEEIRLRVNCPLVLKTKLGLKKFDLQPSQEELSFVINTASRYSPWNNATMASGFLTAPGGHRIGVCGEAVMEGGQARGIRNVTSLCIRVAKDVKGIAMGVDLRENLLIIGPPGSGKTTMLRDLIRRISEENRGMICVVDEREEIFPWSGGKSCFDSGDHTDVLRGYPKPEGMDMALRCMGPDWIVVDEITAQRDCLGLQQAAWCGVKILATAHGAGVEDLYRREVYRLLLETKLFHNALVLGRDKSARMERIAL